MFGLKSTHASLNFGLGPTIWPIIGNVFEIMAADRVYPHLGLAKMAKKYGNIMSIGFGSTYCVILSGYEEMMDLLKRTELTLDRLRHPYADERSFNKRLGNPSLYLNVF